MTLKCRPPSNRVGPEPVSATIDFQHSRCAGPRSLRIGREMPADVDHAMCTCDEVCRPRAGRGTVAVRAAVLVGRSEEVRACGRLQSWPSGRRARAPEYAWGVALEIVRWRARGSQEHAPASLGGLPHDAFSGHVGVATASILRSQSRRRAVIAGPGFRACSYWGRACASAGCVSGRDAGRRRFAQVSPVSWSRGGAFRKGYGVSPNAAPGVRCSVTAAGRTRARPRGGLSGRTRTRA